MALCAYKRIDGKVFYCFEGEEDRLPPIDAIHCVFENFYEKLPPNPNVVQSTTTFMTEDPQLDSLETIYELDRILNIEAEEEREAQTFQVARREM